MGQYHLLVNEDKKEYVESRTGLKAWEQLVNNEMPQVAMLLLTRDNGLGGGDINTTVEGTKNIIGRWAGDKVYWVGDYGVPDTYPSGYGTSATYEQAREEFEDISEDCFITLENALK